MSAPDALQAARWKVKQLGVAAGLGFRVPSTLVTNDPAEAKKFVGAGPTVMKAVSEAYARSGDEERMASTVPILSIDSEDVLAAPVMLQRQIDKVADLRVTSIGRRIFAVRMVVPDGAPLDFRLTDPGAIRYEVIELPEDVSRLVIDYLDAWGLKFGAFDFAEDRSGRLWFLECNPAGQWAWLERATGLNMTSTLLDLLVGA